MLRDRLKELREDLGLNQEEIAKKLNIGRSTYANYENGAAEPNISILIDLATIYNVSIDYICCNTDIKYNYYKDRRLCKYINKCVEVYKEFLK
ncbi:helix-turn-helix transcriptional regulator [Clostridium beijerinckii]|uniref:helix-turn-helix domain-containing protein n=1 Tax=Clostridium beijerinckii TaxID=1520 RepID=UPI0022274728|nr:helix-turn-helix transcriptional regulator [Clostridium beijerinckii]UYZ37300.1 helix-turn-helix transcriptional regulator [Clostridium beijerinckii]